MNKQVKKEIKNNFVKDLIKKENRNLMVVGVLMVCLSALTIGYRTINSNPCEQRTKAIEKRVEKNQSFFEGLDDITNNIQYQCLEYGVDKSKATQVLIDLGVLFEMTVAHEDKEVVLNQSTQIITDMVLADMDYAEGYKLKALIYEQYK